MSANGAPAWADVTIALGDLLPWSQNPRFSTKAQAARLLKSWKELGQFQTIAIGPRNQAAGGKAPVYDGHQRLAALLTLHGPAYAVAARQSDRALEEPERRALALAANLAAGQWDWNALAAWPEQELTDWGMDKSQLEAWNSDALNLREMIGAQRATDNFDFSGLPQSDRSPFIQMTFTLHDSQAEIVQTAITLSKAKGEFFASSNLNSNGNALTRICESYLASNGHG